MSDLQSIYRCTPRQIKAFLIECFEAGLVPFVTSSPGMGKSAILKAIAAELRLWMIDHRLSTSDPTDMNGLPTFVDGFAKFAPFRELFPTEGTPIPKGYEGWMLFFDEFNSAAKAVQAASYKVILDKMIGQMKLHSNVVIALAGNLATDRAIVNTISTALESRVVHLEMELNFEEWMEDVAITESYDSRVISFLNWKQSYLMDFTPDHEGKTYCCPRTWEFMDRLVHGKPITNEKLPLYAGTISAGVAAEFVQHAQIFHELINVKDILADPENCRLPHDAPHKWATISHMMEYIDEDTFGGIAEYASRFDLSFKILFFRGVMVKYKQKYRRHPAFVKAGMDIARYLND